MRKYLFFLFVFGLCLSCTKTTVPAGSASSSGIKYYGTEAGLQPFSMIRTADGGFLFCGQAVHDGTQKFAAFLLKTKSNGDIEWQRFYGGTTVDAFVGVCQASDGGYVAVGYTTSYGLGATRKDYYSDAWIVKTDGNGNQLWMKNFGNIYNDAFYDIKELPDHGFIAVGLCTDTNYEYPANYIGSCYAARTDENGNSLWTHEYFKDRFYGNFYSVSIAPNGDMAMAGIVAESDSAVTININYACMLNLSADGNTTKTSKVYPQFGSTSSEKILPEPDGFVLGLNSTKNNSNSMIFLKTGFDGSITWQKPFTGLSLSNILDDPNGGYTVEASNNGAVKSSQLLQTDAGGNLISTINCIYTNLPGEVTANTTTIGAVPINNGWAFSVYVTPKFLSGNSNFALIFTDLNGKITDDGK